MFAAATAPLLGVRYLLSPLGEGAGLDPDPRFRLDAFDCVTFVETALALGSAGSLEEARRALDDVRYRSRVDVADRLHEVLSQWIPSNLANYRQGAGKDAAFVLHRDALRAVVLTQEDIRQVQLALAAVRAGMGVLLARAGITAADVSEIVITGSFGAALQPADLETLGLLPAGGAARSQFVGNGVLAGLERAAPQPDGLVAIDQLAARLQVIPLSGTPLFEEQFIQSLDFPEVDRDA